MSNMRECVYGEHKVAQAAHQASLSQHLMGMALQLNPLHSSVRAAERREAKMGRVRP